MRWDARRSWVASVAAPALLSPILWVATVTAPVASTPLTGSAFVGRLEQARLVAQAGERAPVPAVMEEVRETIGLPVDLRLPGGTLHIGSDPFLGSLDGDDPGDFRRAAEHILALEADVRSADVVPATDRVAVHRDIAEAYTTIPKPGPLERFMRYARGLATRLFRSALELLTGYRGFGSGLAWATVLVMVILAVLGLRRLGLGLVPERASPRPMMAPTPPDWQRAADEALGRGDLQMAARALYHRLVATLEGRGVLLADPSTTAGECRAAVAGALPEAYPAVVEATVVFERAAYGGIEPTPTDLDLMRAANRRVANMQVVA